MKFGAGRICNQREYNKCERAGWTVCSLFLFKYAADSVGRPFGPPRRGVLIVKERFAIDLQKL